MNKIEKESLKEILRKHKMWLENEHDGERADLNEANLRGADLYGANLSGADLRGADLYGANLYGANLFEANLFEANLSRADLCGADLYGANLGWANLYEAHISRADLRRANLRGANLSGANLSGADLRGANLDGANLSGAKNINIPLACPEKGSFIGFKKAKCIYDARPKDIIVELEITENAIRFSSTGRKCRCSEARVLSITNLDGTPADILEAFSAYDENFVYKVGDIVKVDNFDKNRWNECSTGIHFFITRQEAVDY